MTPDKVQTLKSLNLPEDTMVQLSFEESADVFHYTEDYHDEVLSDTGILSSISSLLSEFRDSVESYGSSLLGNMREQSLLDDYERDGTFGEYLQVALWENHWDLGVIEWSTEKYDHKRGCCTVSANFSVPLSRVFESPDVLLEWEASVKTPMGTLILN